MSRGKRYDDEPKLNIKKVIATILVLLVLIMGIIMIVKFAKNKDKKVEAMNIPISYKTVYTKNKWGVINSKGEYVISPTYDDMILIPDEAKPLFICQKNVELENETYTSIALNDKSERVFASYDNIEAIQNIDTKGALFFYEDTLKVSRNGKYGLINFSGKEILPCEYDSIETIKYLKNSLVTSKDGKKGLVDNGGDVIISNDYSDIEALTDRYENGYIVKDDKNKYGLINYNKKQILECKYDEIKHVAGGNMYVVKEGDSLNLINEEGEIVLKNRFEDVLSIDNGNLIIKQGEKYGIMSSEGETKVEIVYDGLEYLFDGYYKAYKDEKYGIIDLSDKIMLEFNYNEITYMSEEGFIKAENENGETLLLNTQFQTKCKGEVIEINEKHNYIKLREEFEYKYYNFQLEEKSAKDIFPANTLYTSKQDGKYGFVNKNGIIIVECEYEDATEQNEYGYAAIKKNGKWGAIDYKGNIVIEPKYDLNNNKIVSFINQWHLGPDMIANYYTDDN